MADIQGASCDVWYVNGDGGVDNTIGNRGEAYDNAWNTIQFAFNKIADETIGGTGAEIRICKTDDDETHYAVDVSLNPAWDLKELTITGANSIGEVDNTQVLLKADVGLGIGNSMLDIDPTECERVIWANIHFDANNIAQYCINASGGNHYQKWLNCRFSNAVAHGVYKLTNFWDFMNCRFDNNGGDGMRMDSTSYQVCYKCLFDNNTGAGCDTGTLNAFRHKWIECAFYNNGTMGLDASGSGSIICNCIFDGNGEAGLRDRGGSIQTFRAGNIYSNNTLGGVEYYTSTNSVGFNELFYGNRHDTEDNGGGGPSDSESISEYGHIMNYVPGLSAENPNYRDVANFDFSPTTSGGYVGASTPIPYQWYGSTADDIGLNRWINTDSSGVF